MKDAEIVELYWQRDEKAIQETTQKYALYDRIVVVEKI
jgi:hypothetical protein